MGKYTLREVKTAADERIFLEVPVSIYRDDPNWVRPLDADIRRVFDPRRNVLFREGEAVRWVLYDAEGKAAGRIAAFYNREIAAHDSQPTGGCGFFECPDDPEAAALLFDAARRWLQEKGMEAMDGPINFGDRDQWWGLLVDGFHPPIYCMNYHKPYYRALFEGYGFQNYFDQYTYRKDFRPRTLNPLVIEKAKRLRETPGYRFDHIRSKKDLPRHAEEFRTVYNKAWIHYTGVKEITPEHARSLMNQLKPILEGKIVNFAYYKDEPIGFFIMVPDLNRIVRRLKGRFGLWSKLRLLYLLKVRKVCDRVIGLIFAVVPEFQGKGVECGMIEHFREMVEEVPQYEHLQLNWIGDFNPLMMRVAEQYVCAYRYKHHITYRYLFDREKEFRRAPRVSMTRPRPAKKVEAEV